MIQSEKKDVLYYNFFKYLQGKVNVSGNFTGIFRPLLWQIPHNKSTPLIKMTRSVQFTKFKYVVDFFQKWEYDYERHLARYNYSITDIFYWESTGANWVPMFQTELDIAIEEWCPFNCRAILAEILRIEQIHREKFQHILANELWPETLSLPIQPPDIFSIAYIKNNLKRSIYLIMLKLRIFPAVRYVYRKYIKK